MSLKCPQCGAPADPQARNCKFCGESLSLQVTTPPPVQPSFAQPQPAYQQPQAVYMQPVQPQPMYQAPQQSYDASYNSGINPSWPEKSKVAAGVLGILLGGLGIHKFYLGRPLKGILYILFCWTYIPSIIGLVEGIIYLTQSEHNFQVKNQVKLPNNRYA